MAFVDVAVAVGSAVGLEGTAAAIGGGALLGAGAGGLYGAVTGDGSIGHDMLMGGLLGAGGAYGAGMMGWGGEAADTAFGISGSGASVGTGAVSGANGVAGIGGSVPGAVGAGPAATTFTPGTGAAGLVEYGGMAPQEAVSTMGANISPTIGSAEAADAAGYGGYTNGAANQIAGTSPFSAASSTSGGSGLASGFDKATTWMGNHKVMTGLGMYAAANALGLNKQPTLNVPNIGGSGVDTSYFKLDPSTFHPGRPQVTTSPVKPGVTPPYPDYVQNPYQPTGYAAGGTTSDQYKQIQEYEAMLSPQRVNTEDPSWVKDVGVVTDTDPNTKNLSPLDKTRYQLARSYALAGAPTSSGMGLKQATSPYGQINTDPQSVQQQQQTQNAAHGGIMGYSLGGYAHGGNPRLLRGPGDGMSDDIPATIGERQPARLADGEFVVPADVVSHLGNGSTEAGAKKLHGMMDKIRVAKTGRKKQAPQLKTEKFIPS